MNGGTCIDGVDNFTCSCPPRLTGTLCECLILADNKLDCDYTSPTPFPDSSQTVIFTTLYEEYSTTDHIGPTTYSIGYNDSIPKTPSFATEIEAWSTTTEIIESTTVAGQTQKTTGIETTTDIEGITTTDETTLTDVTETLEPASKPTIDTHDSKLDTTTECKESCENTESTKPGIDFETTTSLIAETTKADVDITEFTDAGETTTNVVTDMTINEGTAEVTPTPKVDSTTESMFTDTPTEHATTDLPLPPTISTTEPIDVTTVFDNTTYLYTTIQSECTDSVCNNHGTCIVSPHGIRVCMQNQWS